MADSVERFEGRTGVRREEGAGGGQGGKPVKKEMKQGSRLRWVETRNALTTPCRWRGLQQCSGQI